MDLINKARQLCQPATTVPLWNYYCYFSITYLMVLVIITCLVIVYFLLTRGKMFLSKIINNSIFGYYYPKCKIMRSVNFILIAFGAFFSKPLGQIVFICFSNNSEYQYKIIIMNVIYAFFRALSCTDILFVIFFLWRQKRNIQSKR